MRETSQNTAEALLAELGWVRALARSLVRDSAAAEDLVQESCLAILSAAPDSVPKPRGFLRAVLHNAARARARSDIARRERELAVAAQPERATPDEIVLRMERQRQLAEAVLALDEPFRSTVVLRYLDGLEPSEIARRQGVPAGTVRRRLKTALERLRERLDRSFDGGRESWAVALLPMLDLHSAWVWEMLGIKKALIAGTIAMKKSLIAASVLVIGAGVVAVSVWRESPMGGPAELATVARSLSESAPQASGASETALVESLDVGGRSAASSAALEQRELGARIAGRVLVPAGCAADDTLEVLALDRPLAYAQLARLIDEAPFDREAARALEASLIGRAGVRASGEFELDVWARTAANHAATPAAADGSPGIDAGISTAHLAVRGRTLYTPETRPVVLDRELAPVVLIPRTGGCLRVQLSAAGAAVAGTPLRLGGSAAELTPAAGILGRGHSMNVCAGPDGRFEFRALPLDHSYQLFALPEKHAAQKTELAQLDACTARELALSLNRGASVRGRVVGLDLRPVAGADVDVLLPGRWLGLDDRRVRSTRTQPDGSFELSAVPIGVVHVLARKSGHLESEKLELHPLDGGLVTGVELALGRGEAIVGQVSLAGAGPIADAELMAEFDAAYLANETAVNARRGASASTRSDAQGRFALAGLGKGPFTVRARATLADGTHVCARRDGVRPCGVDSDDAAGRTLELVLHPPLVLHGVVRDALGEPVRSFDVEAVRVVAGALGLMGMKRERRHFEDAQGRFALAELDQGLWVVDACSAGLVSCGSVSVELPSALAGAPIEIQLEPAAAVLGRVIGRDGRGAAAAIVSVQSGAGEAADDLAPRRVPPKARSETDGSFRLDGVSPGALRIVAVPADGSALASEPTDLVLASGATHAGLELFLRAGSRLTGDVYDDRGRPAHGHMVHLTHARGETRFTAADANGRFDFEHLEPGRWAVVAMDMAGAGSRPKGTGEMDAVYSTLRLANVELVDGGSEHVVLGMPHAAPVQVSGTVTQAGQPRGGGWISFFPREGGDVQRLKIASVDGDGHYETTLAGPGAYTASIQQTPGNDDSSIDFQRDVPAGAAQRLDFVLPSGRIRGRVLEPHGAAAVGARVTLFSEGASHSGEYCQGHYAEVSTDAGGRFDLPGLRGGKYSIAVGGPAEGECFARVVLDEVALADDATRDDLVVRLPAPGSIAVRARDAEGEPVEGAAIFVHDVRGLCVDPLSPSVTDARGHGAYDCLAPGTYTVQARGGRLASEASESLRVIAGEETTLELRLVAGTRLEVELTDEGGRALNGWVSVFDAGAREVGGLYAARDLEMLYFAGTFSPCAPVVGPLVPGRYRLEAAAPGGLKALREITLASEPKMTVTLTLSR